MLKSQNLWPQDYASDQFPRLLLPPGNLKESIIFILKGDSVICYHSYNLIKHQLH